MVTMALVLAGILPASTYALSSSQLDFFAENNILFYDPDSGSCGYNSVGSYSGTASAGLTELQAGFVDTYHSIAEKLTIGYGLPWETVIAQGILESTQAHPLLRVSEITFLGLVHMILILTLLLDMIRRKMGGEDIMKILGKLLPIVCMACLLVRILRILMCMRRPSKCLGMLRTLIMLIN